MAAKPQPVGGRWALGISYRGAAYNGWQSQPDGLTVQDHLERALSTFANVPVSTVCAGRTDAGVHAVNQVVHFDAPVEREPFSWVRGTNRYLPPDIAVQWGVAVPADFHARFSARGRRYRYVLLQSPVR
ncbi:MAG TPA: tRNA pseudouridine synthase A, partial [Burkholderiaceae bacterium]|nr:tRNA pseudouridine synthase A [Burkholderiaceae bacterium]